MAWEIKGTTGSLDFLPTISYQSKVSAPKNPKLIKEHKKTRRLTPSEFLKEMSMDTKQKLANTHEMYLPRIIELLDMGETSLQKNTNLVVDEPMFQPYPSEIYFQKYDPFTTYEVPLLLRNNDKVPRLVKVTQVDTPYFKIITSADAHQKVGPGLPVVYKIQFLPEENKDYYHELIVSTEREKFIIPIRCIGSRAILDFPDEINFSVNSICPVKHPNSKVLLIRNIGNRDAKFSLKTDKPFTVTPDHGILPIGENMQVTVEFQPIKCGEYKKDLTINYDSNETVYVGLYGAAQDVNVRLDKNSLRIEDTYITMTNQRTITIHNRSDIIVHYEWKKFATIEEEEQQKLKEITILSRDEENAKNKLSNQNPDYIALLSRNFQNKIRNSHNKSFHFEDNVFFIQPIEGDIWPNSSIDVNIIFKPDFAQTYNKIAYCDATGRESRLPLRLCGIGCGPKVQLSIEKLDIGSVFIGSTHVYEVVLANKGFIDAIYSVIIPNTQFGKCFLFEPNEGLISPNGYQAISICFGTNKLGDFNEIFEFTIDGKQEKNKLIICGSVIPPTFQFDVDKIRFNQVSYGFKYSHNCILKNTSLVPMTFNLRVASDSEARDAADYDFNNENESDLYNFKEFSIVPSSGFIPPQSEIKILLEFIPHFIKKYDTSLIVDIEDVGTELLMLPITARSSVPSISVITTNVDMGRCFIYHSYEKFIKLSNETPLKARYFLVPSKSEDPIKFTSNNLEGVIEANSIKEISIYAEATKLDDIEGDLFIKINGSVEPLLKCHFKCLSQGPVVQIYPRDIDWGLTTVLHDSYRDIVISNESLIEAKFKTRMSKKNSPWRVEPSEGVVEPGSEMVLKAICYLIDKTRYDDVINIDMEHSYPVLINVKALGGGSSIVSEPNIGNLVDFGTYFSGGVVKRNFILTNKSSRPQSLNFVPENRANLNKKELAKAKNLPAMIFKVTPNRVELNPGESKDITINGIGEKPQLVDETYLCFSIIGKTSGKDRIMKFRIKCEFISPLVSFSTRDLVFRCEHDGEGFPPNQTRELTISNISSLDVTAKFSLNNPFYLIDEETRNLTSELILNIKTRESLLIRIVFDTSFKKDFHNEVINRVLTISYAEHDNNDTVNLIGDIYFPNIRLESNKVDFGCILNNTEVYRDLKMTNIGPLTVHYKWKFLLEKDNVLSNQVTRSFRSVSENDNNEIDESAKILSDTATSTDKDSKETVRNDNLVEISNEATIGTSVDLTNEVANTNNNNKPNSDIEAQSTNIPDSSDSKKSNKLDEFLSKQQQQNEIELPSIEEIFDISPLYGYLHPGESQSLKITYFGHKEIKAYVKALCEIKNGPNYELLIQGEASVLSYELSDHLIDLGYVPFDEVSEAQIKIKNLGKVNVEYTMIGFESELSSNTIELDKPILVPAKGFIEAENEITVTIRYLPGMPKKFSKKMLIQISHFAPEEITIKGEAGFADIMLDLPRLENDVYKNLLKDAKNLIKYKEHQKIENENRIFQSLISAPELDIQIEVDRLAVQTFVKQTNNLSSNLATNDSDLPKPEVVIVDLAQSEQPVGSDYLCETTEKKLLTNSSNDLKSFVKQEDSSNQYASLIQPLSVEMTSLHNSFVKSAESSKSLSKKKPKPILPDYVLDFGHVILGTVKTHVIRAANMGKLLASFDIERQNFSKTGFLIDLEKVKNLPNEDSVEFVVTFDPRGANLGLGPIEHVIPLNIHNGPIVNIRLKANVTMPDLQVSSDVVEFGDVKCGECKIVTIQIYNHKEVRCDWSASYLPKRDEKFTPMHLKRKKKLDEPNKPRIFEIMPPNGILMPGQKVNIQLKFMPIEEKNYEERVTIRMAQSSQRLMMLCKGKGLEPRIEFSKNSLEFETILPHSSGDEQEVRIINPCSFPIEIYNLEFDKNFLEEEKILRVIRGYDEFNTVLLPPRVVNEKLPNELYEYYEELTKKLTEEENKQKQNQTDSVNQVENSDSGRQPMPSADTEKTKSKSDELANPKSATNKPVGDVEKNPVFDSIARYLGIDLSLEGKAARNRRGVAIIVNGPPLSGKSRAAVALAKYYECALLTIDSIVIDAIANSTSSSAVKARQLCAEAAAKYAEETKALDQSDPNKQLNNSSINAQNGQAVGLSVEALAQHSINQGGLQGGSKKTSVAGDSHTNAKGAKKAKTDISNTDQSSTHPSSPPPLLAPIARKFSISTNLFNQDEGYMSTVLPEDVIVELLSERFQLSDCSRGIVIDGLDTLFAQNYLLAATAVLKAFNNRRYIYCFTMKSDFQKYKEQLNKIQEEKLKAKKEKELMEQLYLEEMDEDTYKNLPPEKKKEIDDRLLETKKKRLKKEAEEKAAAERERIEREQAEQARLEEERKKNKKKTGPIGKEAEGKKSILPSASTHMPKSQSKDQGKESKEANKEKTTNASSHAPSINPVNDRPHTRVDGGGQQEDPEKLKRVGKTIAAVHEEEQVKEKIIDPEEEKRKEAERLLQQRFKTFDLYSKDFTHLLDAWDRTQGNIFRQVSPSENLDHEEHMAGRKPKKDLKGKDKEKDKKEKEKEKQQEAEKAKAEQLAQQQQQHQQPPQQQLADISENIDKEEADNQAQSQSTNEESKKLEPTKEDGIGVPHIIFEATNKIDLEEIYKHPKLPPIAEVLDGMGLGPKGPPIPPPAIFAVVPYPTFRKSPPGSEFSRYAFVTTNENDPNLYSDEKPKESIMIPETTNAEGEKTPENPQSKGSSKPTKTSKTNTARNESRNDKNDKDPRRASGGDKKRSESKMRRESGAVSPNRGSSSLSGNQRDDNYDGSASMDGSGMDKPSQKLQRFRWIVPQNSEITIRLRFTSEETGQFDQTLNFEIVGTRRRYQLHCRGICTFPTITREPRIVFPNRKKCKENNEIIHKKYLLTEDIFEFGPLLVGNNKERCKEGKFPEYQETLTIQNASPLEAEVSFCFLEESSEKSEGCYFLEPSELTLKPNESKFLKIYATPKENKLYEDTLVCCVKENPEPITFKISCIGQKPELVLDKKEFAFKQVLLHRKDSREIKMSNNTLIPVQWRIEGVDLLGDEFVCNQTTGIIDPLNSFNLILHFRALKPLIITPKDKKVLKVLVSSLNSFLGFMENHTILVTAEAYDVALEINLPKGNDGGLDFGNIRVNSENKLNCTLRNKGKYPIKYNFLTESTGPETLELLKFLTVSPATGELPSAHDRNSQNQVVQVSVHPKKQIMVKDSAVLKCQITEPSVGEGTVIANIPIKITVKAVVSEFNLIPQSEINFGPLHVNSKRQDKIIIENKGELDFKFTISKYSAELAKSMSNSDSNLLNQERSNFSRLSLYRPRHSSRSQSKASSRRNSGRDGAQIPGRLQIGIYTITPAYSIILPNGHQVITIDCAPEAPGLFEEELLIDITDRNMQQYPNGIKYKLSCDSSYPSILPSIEMFEEHTIIPNISALDPKMMGIGIYVEDENRFIFNNVIVGRTAKARFKLINSNKIPVDINILLKASNKASKAMTDSTFEVEPTRVQIAPYNFTYATVSFSPLAMTSYSSYLEATLENLPNSMKNKAVSFEISGEGNLPRFTILKPTLKNKKGQCLMLFKRSVVNNVDTQQLVLSNDGTLATKINFFLYDPDSAFKLKPNKNEKHQQNGIVIKETDDTISSVVIQPNSQVSFIVTCLPKSVQTYQASLQLTVIDNQFEDTLIQMIGEGYMEDVIFENLHSLVSSNETEDVLSDEDVTALRSNLISFGDVYVNEKKQLLFTMKNQSKSDCYRFEWPVSVQSSNSIHPIGGQQSGQPNSNQTAAQSDSQTNGSSFNDIYSGGIVFSPRIGHLHAGCAKDITVTFKSPEPKYMFKDLFNCLLTKISFDQPINEVKDWDDRITVVKWVNELVTTTPLATSNQENLNSASQRQQLELANNLTSAANHQQQVATNQTNQQQQQHQPAKQIIRKKIIEIESEPRYSRLDEVVQPLELFVSVNCDYCKYRCKTNAIRFKDTLIFQTRVYEVSVINRGKIQFDYNWRVVMEDSRRPFTPLIQHETPTPEHSQSPRGRGSKTSKTGTDSSVSPTRKPNGKGDSNPSKEQKKDSKGNSTNKKLSNSKVESLDDTIKSNKGGSRKPKDKDTKSQSGDQEDASQTTKTSKDRDFLDATNKLSQLDLNELTARLGEDAQTGRPDSQAQMRAESALSHNAPSSIAETGYIPFMVEPAFGKIEPGKTQTFKVKFAPLNIHDYQARLICQIPNTEDGRLGPIIAVKGRGLLPYCHFELEESDYITSGRRNPELPGPAGAASGLGLDPMTKVIEFNCVGLESKIVKTFEILNPTNSDYGFEWLKEEQNDVKKNDEFSCLQPSGTLISGKKYEITFEFEPSEVGVHENFWKFRIPKYDLNIPFLLVGIVNEPKVIFDKSHISFKSLLIGRTGREEVNLINQENKPLAYSFDQTSCYSEGRSAVVIVDPASGILEPNIKTPIYLSFQPKEQRAYVFNLRCKLNCSNKLLNLNVKGEGFAMQTSLFCEDSNNGNRIEFSDSSINEIHMGEVEKNEICFRNLYVFNNGKHRVNYEWVLASQFEDSLSCFSIEPQIGEIEPGDKKHCMLKYEAKHEKSTIASLILKIENGSVYHVHLDGIAVRPDLQFSFTNFDFGPCFIYKAGMKLKSTTLNLTNRGNKDLNVSCLSENSNSVNNSCFQFDFKQMILMPGKSTSTTITFIPRECKAYNHKIVFELNGLTKREINLKGIGTQLKIELVDLKQKTFDVGTLQVGKISQKKLQIVNRSVAPVEFNLLFEPKSEYLSNDKSVLKIEPVQNINLKPNQFYDIQFKFSPKSRIPKFIEDLNIEYNGINLPLCSIQGACHGYNIWLDMSTLPFGAVTQKCSIVKRLKMQNDGDIGASFKWEADKLKPDFSIYPLIGYISPGMEINFDVTFNPTELATDIRKENIKCFIEGNHPLVLTLTGSCVQVVPQKEVHHFDTLVRQKETKQITISNRTNAIWELKPIIEGEYFSGLESFVIEPQSSNSFEITYYPLTMTTLDGKKHTGSIFFPLPDGTGLLYNLTGSSNPPKAIGKIPGREVPCKTHYTEILSVENWLKKPQRFKVIFEITKPDRPDPSTTIKGNDYVDVPGNGRKEYKVNYFAHKEGLTSLRVIFKNEQTNEYCFYEMTFRAVKGGSITTIDLVTQVRVPISYSLRLENPLNNMVTFNATCTNTNEILIPTSLSITGKGQGDFNFEFLPLKAVETTSKLELSSTDLGTCVYDLNLKATPAANERPIYFKTSLGNSQTLIAKITNFCRQKTDYTCKIDNQDFKVDKSIPAAPSQSPSGIEVSFEITFEPSSLVDTRANLVLSSPIGGDYIIPLFGSCLPPKPQGPFVVKANTNTSISFKNVFASSLTFSFAIDNPLFHVTKSTETIKPHQIHKIVVGFDGNDSPNKADVMAKLVVTAPKSAGVANNVQWIYYLKGTS